MQLSWSQSNQQDMAIYMSGFIKQKNSTYSIRNWMENWRKTSLVKNFSSICTSFSLTTPLMAREICRCRLICTLCSLGYSAVTVLCLISIQLCSSGLNPTSLHTEVSCLLYFSYHWSIELISTLKPIIWLTQVPRKYNKFFILQWYTFLIPYKKFISIV